MSEENINENGSSKELPEAFWCRVSGTLGPGFLGAARCSLSRRAHVKAKGTLDSVEQKNYAVGEQKLRSR